MAEGATTRVTVTITDNDAAPLVSFASSTAAVTEGTATASVTVQLTGSSPGVATFIPIRTRGGTARTGDYTATVTNVMFAAEASGTDLMSVVTIPISDDDVDEPAENFTVGFGTLPSTVTEGATSSVTVTITDNDNAPTVSFDAPSGIGVVNTTPGQAASVPEGSSISVKVALNGPPSEAVDIPLTVAGGASRGVDYNIALNASNQAVVSFSPGDWSPRTIRINTIDNNTDESNKDFTLTLPTNANLPAGITRATGAETYTVTIIDNDDPPDPTVSLSGVVTGDLAFDTAVLVPEVNRNPTYQIQMSVTLSSSPTRRRDHSDKGSRLGDAGG